MNTRSNSAKIGYFTIQAFTINKAFLKKKRINVVYQIYYQLSEKDLLSFLTAI